MPAAASTAYASVAREFAVTAVTRVAASRAPRGTSAIAKQKAKLRAATALQLEALHATAVPAVVSGATRLEQLRERIRAKARTAELG